MNDIYIQKPDAKKDNNKNRKDYHAMYFFIGIDELFFSCIFHGFLNEEILLTDDMASYIKMVLLYGRDI